MTTPARRLAYLGTPEMSVPPLRALDAAGFEIVLVVTNPDRRRGRGSATTPSPVKAAALELGLPVTHDVDDVVDCGADLGVVVAFGRIIRPHVLAALPMVNLHFSLLPRWRGAAPVERAILAGDPTTGVDLMVVEEGLDTGAVHARVELDIGRDESADALRHRLVSTGSELLVETLAAGLGTPSLSRGSRCTHTRSARTTFGSTGRNLRSRSTGRCGWAAPGRRGTASGSRSGARASNRPARESSTRPATGRSSCSRCSPPASRGSMRRRGPTVPDGRSTTGWERERPPTSGRDESGVAARRLALDALVRIDEEGAYANLVTNALLDRSDLADRDRHFVTDLVYGTTRMKRACDHLVDRYRRGDVTPRVAAALRLGAYQLAFADVAHHAAVDTTVGATPKPARGLVNAILRRIAGDAARGVVWPDIATELSYPDWVVSELVAAVGAPAAHDALRAMNEPATTHRRSDGYVQDLASQSVVDRVGAQPGERVIDLCAAPGGKATGMATSGALVVASDLSAKRARLVVDNASRVGSSVTVVVADGVRTPFRSSSFDRVLVDAPCSGLGVLRRRADARWNIDAGAPERLRALQGALVTEGARLLAPGGTLVYSVCTLTNSEGPGVLDDVHLGPDIDEQDREILLPDADQDGMFVARWLRTGTRAPG